ncbi:MAG: hypothetical protein IKR19_08370 [Acholeplasmatales bacterium]|nr:hypothetical protein [Acholeplasmatales bacterium]
MGMTIDQIIVKETEIAQEFQVVLDTHITIDGFSLEELYCDDTEVIDEHLQRCKVATDYHNQIANTMRKYQKIEKIIEDWESDKGWALEMSELYWLDKIKEVIENGKID